MYRLCSILMGGWLLLSMVTPAFASPSSLITSKAKQAILVDVTTGSVLYEKNAYEQMPPSSMSKLMTLYLLFEQLQSGLLSLDDRFPVSEKAWRKKGSKMFVGLRTRVSIEDLIRGIIVQSGNDACIVVAEGIAGSEESFADLMNRKAESLGLKHSHFVNATGWPHEQHYMSAYDLATLSMRLMADFPEYYYYFAEKVFTYNKIKQYNRNLLLNRDKTVDGLKTGHTEVAGYGLAASAIRNNRRLVAVVNGLDSKKARADEAQRLLRYGFTAYENKTLFKKGDQVEKAAVWMGEKKVVPLVIAKDLVLTLPRHAREKMEMKVMYEGPIPAPIKKGDAIATLSVVIPGGTKHVVPLYAADSVGELSFFGRVMANMSYYLTGQKSE